MTTDDRDGASGSSPGEKWALAYARAGHPLFPVKPRDKTPLTPHWREDATTDAATILGWLAQHPTMNIGLPTGFAFDVLDVDAKHDGPASLERLCADLGIALPTTATAQTGGGGRHYCFAPHPGLKSGANVFGAKYPGLDIRARGGYIVAPPSTHESGKPYGWLKGLGLLTVDPAPWPPALLGAIAGKRTSARDDGLRGVAEGSRNATMAEWVGRWIARGLNKDDVTARALTRDETNVPPLGVEVVTDMVERLWAAEQAKPKPLYHLTDTGNAERFRDQHRHHARYCPQMREHGWFIYDGTKWVRDARLQVDQWMKETLLGLYEESKSLDGDAGVAMRRWALQCESEVRRQQALRSARSEMVIEATEFDRDPYILNCPNGTLDLWTGERREHRPDDLCTKVTRAAYHPEARDPLWDAFLVEKIPDLATRLWMQKVAGHVLTGDRQEDIVINIHGASRTGKTTFCSALREMLGDYADGANADTFMAGRSEAIHGNRPDLAKLIGLRLVVSAEAEEHMRLNEALVKEVAGCDIITAAAKYENPISFKPTFFWIFYGNHQVKVREEEEAIWNRIRVVPFEVAVEKEHEDQSIRDHLVNDAKAHEAILAWAVEGLRAYHVERLRPLPALVERSTGRYRNKMSILNDFIEAECLRADKAPAGTLRSRYETWFGEQPREYGKSKLGMREWAEKLRALGCEDVKGTGGVRYWLGISLKPRGVAR